MSYYIECPHCKMYIEIIEINCGIFRHGCYKLNNENIPPHLSKIDCEKLVINGIIYGCGKPFKFDGKNVTICEYI